jgi:hypothetical protein
VHPPRIGKAVGRRIFAATAYVLAVCATLLVALELSCRAGLLPNQAVARRRHSRAPASRRTLMLGDSFAYEEPREAGCYGRRMRAWLEERGVNTVSLAAGGFGPYEYFESLDAFLQIAPEYRPDLIVVNYYAGNDVSDTLFRRHGRAPRTFHSDVPLLRSSYLARLLVELWERRYVSRRKAELRVEMRRQGVSDESWNAVLFDACRRRPSLVEDNLLVASSEPAEAWREIEGSLDSIVATAHRLGARMLVNIFPSTLQVNRSHAAQYMSLGCHFDERVYDSAEPQQRLLRWCARSGVACHDLLPAFRANAAQEAYQHADEHWNERGNALAFAAVAATIESQHLLDR